MKPHKCFALTRPDGEVAWAATADYRRQSVEIIRVLRMAPYGVLETFGLDRAFLDEHDCGDAACLWHLIVHIIIPDAGRLNPFDAAHSACEAVEAVTDVVCQHPGMVCFRCANCGAFKPLAPGGDAIGTEVAVALRLRPGAVAMICMECYGDSPHFAGQVNETGSDKTFVVRCSCGREGNLHWRAGEPPMPTDPTWTFGADGTLFGTGEGEGAFWNCGLPGHRMASIAPMP